MLRRIALVLIGVGLVAGVAIGAQQATPTTQPPKCSLPGQRTYDRGAILDYQGTTYQCLSVFGQELRPAGLAWVKMERADVFVPVR